MALRIKLGFVVASWGLRAMILLKSPVSMTIFVYCERASNWFMAVKN